jgi:hypothetical protein
MSELDENAALTSGSEIAKAGSTNIFVNTLPKAFAGKLITYEQVVGLADGLITGPNVYYSVTYRKGPEANPEGSLVQGSSVKVKKGMTFNVRATDKS